MGARFARGQWVHAVQEDNWNTPCKDMVLSVPLRNYPFPTLTYSLPLAAGVAADSLCLNNQRFCSDPTYNPKYNPTSDPTSNPMSNPASSTPAESYIEPYIEFPLSRT